MRWTWMLAFVAFPVQADVITEFGLGYKVDVSFVLSPGCERIHDHKWNYETGGYEGTFREFPCGGDNPAFIGWPLAWESEWKGKHSAMRYRVGWLHYSNWFDGGETFKGVGDGFETHMDLIAAVMTVNWTRRRRSR